MMNRHNRAGRVKRPRRGLGAPGRAILLLALLLIGSRAGAQEREPLAHLWWPVTGEEQAAKDQHPFTTTALSLGGEVRLRFEGRQNAGFNANHDDGYLLSRFRVHLDVHPIEWFRIYIEGQDSQAMGLAANPDPPVFEDTFDLRQAYIDLFHRQHKGWGLRVGRQELIFGEERLIGAFNWGNTARTFDAARLYYENQSVRLDAFAAAVVRIQDARFNRTIKGDNLYGIHTTFRHLIPQARWDVYTFWRAQSRVVNEQGKAGDADRVTFGSRLVGTLPGNFDYDVEAAGQVGNFAGDDVRAWAAHVQVGYTLANARTTPRLLAEYNYASGDDDPTDGEMGTFDQLFPTNHNKYGIADLVGWRNIHNLRLGLSLKPMERINIRFDTHSFWLASRRDAFYNAGGRAVARVAEGARSRHVGEELDVYGSVKLEHSFSLGAGLGYLFAGSFLKQATPGKNTSFAYAMLVYRF